MSEQSPRILVASDLCEANAICERFAPSVFLVEGDADQMKLLVERVPAELAGKVAKAIARCPRGALSLSED